MLRVFKLVLCLSIFFIIILNGCSVRQQIHEAKNFMRCEFSFHQISDLRLADMDIQGFRSVSDMTFKKAVRLASALSGKEIPLTFTLWVGVYNPNDAIAALNRLEWICNLDGNEIARGVLDSRIEVRSRDAVVFPVQVSSDLKKFFNRENRDTFLNMILNLTSKEGEPVHLQVNIKPTLVVAGTDIEYPRWITLEKEFDSEDGKKVMKKLRKSLNE